MRKTSKFLALILSLALLTGALAVAVFANEEEIDSPSPVLDITNQDGTIVNHNYSDLEGAEYKSDWQGVTGTFPSGAGSANAAAKNHAHIDTRNNMGNTYAAFWFDRYAADAFDPDDLNSNYDTYHDLYISSGYKADAKKTEGDMVAETLKVDAALLTNDYVVFDWDLASDKYLLDRALTDTWSEDATLAYYYGITMSLAIRGGGTSYQYGMGSSSFKLGMDTNGWYLYNTASPNEKAYLSQKLGEWNHITLVLEVNNKIDINIDGQDYSGKKFMEAIEIAKAAGRSEEEARNYVVNNAKNYQIFDSQIHGFLNGEHFVSAKYLTDKSAEMGENGYFTFTVDGNDYYISPAHFYLYNIRMTDGISKNVYSDGKGTYSSYSVAFDNVTTHYYKSGYKAPEGSDRNLSSFMTSESYKNKNLASCKDVVYNGNYQMPTPNTIVASVKVDDTVTGYYTKQGAEDALVPNATLILEDGTKYTDFIVTFKFKVKTNNPENFVIKNANEYSLAPTSEENVYAIKGINEIDSIPYYVYDFEFDDWQDKDAIEEGFVLEGSTPTLKKESAFTLPLFAEKNPSEKDGLFTQFDGWDMYYKVTAAEAGQDGVIYDEILNEYWCLCPVKMIDSEIAMNNGAGIFLYPRYVDVQYEFSIVDAETGSLVPNVNYKDVKEMITSVRNTVDTKAGTYIITLYEDLEVKYSAGETASIQAKPGCKVYFDLNGHTFITNLDTHNMKASTFYTYENSEMYIYSSKAGGRVFNFTYRGGYERPNGGALLGSSGSVDSDTAPKFYLGTVRDEALNIDADGDNLFASFALLIEVGTSKNYFNGVYETDPVTGLPVDKNNDGIIGTADKKADAPTYYNEIHIDGGTYTRANSDGGGMIKTNAFLHVDVKNAMLIGANIFATDSRYNSRITGTVDNTICYAMGSSVFGQFCEGSSLTFTNSVLLGGLGFSGCTYSNWSDAKYNIDANHPLYTNAMLGKVYLGEGTKISGELTSQILPAEGVSAVSINECYRENTVWYAPSFTVVDNTIGTLKQESLTTPVNLTQTYKLTTGYTALGNFATINWISAGKTLESVQVPVIGPKFYSFEIMPTVDTTTPVDGTDLFRLGVDHWVLNGNELPSQLVLEAGSTLDFTAVMGGIIAPDKKDLAPLLQSQETRTKFTSMLYIPMYKGATVVADGITYIISDSVAERVSNSTTTISGNALSIAGYDGYEFFKYVYGYPSPMDLGGGSATIKISYTVTKVVDPEDSTKNVVETVSYTYNAPGLGGYLQKAFENAKNDTEKKLLANVIQYCLACCEFNGKTSAERTKLETFIKNNEEYARCVTNLNSEAFNAKVAAAAAKTPALPAGLEDYVKGIIFYDFGGVPTLAVNPVNNVVNGDKCNIASIRIDFNSFGKAEYKYLTVAVVQNTQANINNGSYKDYFKDPYGNNLPGQRNSSNIGYHMDINGHLSAFDINNVFSFSITTVDHSTGTPVTGEVFKFTYTLADYIVELENTDAVNELLVMKALAAYGEASVEYLRATDAQ